MEKSRTGMLTASVAALLVISFSPPAIAATPQPTIDLNLDNLDAIVDSTGKPIRIESETIKPGLRTVLGETADGAPVVVQVHSAPPTGDFTIPDPSIAAADATENWSSEPVPASVETFSGEDYPADTSAFVPVLAVAATPTSVSIAVPTDSTITKSSRDGRPVADSTDGSELLVDTVVQPATEHRYNLEVANPESEEVSNYSLDVTTPAATGDSHTAARQALAVTTVYGQDIYYTTFIPLAKVTGSDVYVCTLTEDRAFGGDNRSWQAPLAAHRTEVQISPWFPRPNLWVSKHVSPTTLYELSTGNLIETRTAPNTGITFSDQQSTTTYAQVKVTHSVGNPFCSAGAISYSAMVRAWETGMVEITGKRLPAPNHEAWVLPGANATKPYEQLFGYANEGFPCLTGICGERTTSAIGDFE